MKAFRPVPKPERPIRGTAEAKRWMSLVAQLGCILPGCGVHPVQLHHVAHGRFSQSRSSDLSVLPLCPKHHQFRTDHGETWAQMYGFDHEYLSEVKRQVEALDARTIGGRP